MVSKNLKLKAFKLRQDGYSYKYIESTLGINRSTLSNWFNKLAFTPNQHTLDRINNSVLASAKTNRAKRIARINSANSLAQTHIQQLSQRDLLMIGLGLYMGEGSKTNGIVRFSNSDPNMIKLFLVWMKSHFALKTHNFAMRIHSYPDIDIDSVENYWLAITKLPKQCLRKTYIDQRNTKSKKPGKLPYGTAHISVVAQGDKNLGIQLFRLIKAQSDLIIDEFAGLVQW